MLDIQEVRQYAIYEALSTIFFNASDSKDDVWFQKHLKYQDLAKQQIDYDQIVIDNDDDGLIDVSDEKDTRFNIRSTGR